jgi:DNA-binding YbaB/EbfC family protein
MDMNANLGNLMKEAQKMQKKMQDAQQQLTDMLVVGESGGGLVRVEMNGRHDVKKVNINNNLMDEDAEMIGDLVAAAVNDAVRKIEKASKDKISQLTAGLNIPTDFGGTTDDSGTDN